MKKTLRTIGILLIFLSIIVFLIQVSFVKPPQLFIAFLLFLSGIILITLTSDDGVDRNKMIFCDNCKTSLKFYEVKFGLCSKCGAKVKGYKYGNYYHW